jgi:hypothetical protein
MSSQIVSSCPSIREEVAQEVYRDGWASPKLFWYQFPSLWPPLRWGMLVDQLQEKIESLPHGKLVWPHLEPHIATAIELGVDCDEEDPIGPSDDGMWTTPRSGGRIFRFINEHDDYHDCWQGWIHDVYSACNAELHAEHEAEWQEMRAGIKDGYARLADDEH